MFDVKKYRESIEKIGRDKLIIMAAAVIVIIVCIFWESGDDTKSDNQSDSDGTINTVKDNGNDYGDMEKYVEYTEKRLLNILKSIEGVGKVQVMITVGKSEEHNVFTEKSISYEDTDEADSSGGTRKNYTYSEDNNTVYITDENGNTRPYVISEYAPVIKGVAVVAEGADEPTVKLKIFNVIKALFSIEANKITVEDLHN